MGPATASHPGREGQDRSSRCGPVRRRHVRDRVRDAGRSEFGLSSALFIGGIVVALVLLLGFAEYESRLPPGARLLNFKLIAKPAYWGANVGVFTSTAALLVILYFFNLYAQSPVVFGLNAIEASLALLPYGVALFVVSLVAGKMTDAFGYRLPVTIGMIITSVGLLLLAAVSLDDTLSDLLLPLGPAGAGAGATFAATGAAAMSVAPADEAGEAAGTANTSRYMGAHRGRRRILSVRERRARHDQEPPHRSRHRASR